jgi:hypothetical protein
METSIAGKAATSAVVTIPAWGIWYLEAVIAGEHSITGAISCAIADMVLAGTVLHCGAFNGRTYVKVVGGRGGLAKELPPRAYHDDAGVRVATVLGDVLREAGETVDESTLPTTRVGPHYTRPSGTAADVLARLVPGAWYVSEAGVVRVGARPSGTLPAGVAVVTADKSRGTVEVKSSSIAPIVPGVVAEGLTVTDVRHEVDGDAGLRSMLYGRATAGTSRRLTAWRKMLEALDPDRAFRGVVEYRVVTREGPRLNLQPVRSGLGMPSLRRVPTWPGVPGVEGDVVPGSRVLVGWIDSDPSRPYVSAHEGSEGAGYVPDEIRLAEGTRGVARDRDTICHGYYLWDSVLRTLYRSPPELGPTLTVYVPWAIYGSGTDLSASVLPVPTPTVPPPPGTPGTAATGVITSASILVRCA